MKFLRLLTVYLFLCTTWSHAQQVLISHKGGTQSGWYYTSNSGPDQVTAYEVYYTRQPDSQNDIDSQLFVSQLASPGGIYLGGKGEAISSFYHEYITNNEYAAFLEYNKKQTAQGKGITKQADYFKIKYPGGIVPNSHTTTINGKKVQYYYKDDRDGNFSIKRLYHIFIYLNDTYGVNFLGKVNYFDASAPSPSPLSFDTYDRMLWQHLKELEFDFNGSTTQGTSSETTGANQEDDIPWSVVIGVLTAAAVAAIIRQLAKKKKDPGKKDKKEEKENAHYVLQLNKEQFELIPGQPDTLHAAVYKITEKGRKQCASVLQVQNAEKSLKISPQSGQGSLQAQLILKEQPEESRFNIVIIAQADGHEFQKKVTITTSGEKNLQFETEPGNKRSLRPDTYQVITCYAQVLDEKGKNIADLTDKISFVPQDDWIDMSKPFIEEERIGIYIGCSNPNPNNSNATPPPTVTVTMTMDEVPEGEEPLQKDLVIQLLDCKLDTEIDDCTFPATEEMSEITFDAYIENAGEEKGWNFNAEYRLGVDRDDPLTDIAINKKSEITAEVTLTGPILKPKEGESYISKTLVIMAAQGDEEPLERHITVIVSSEGLLVKHGVNKNNEFNFLADKPVEQNFDFSLQVYDENTNEITVDKNALSQLEFELLSEEKEIRNLISVLLPQIDFIDLVTNIPYGRYRLTTDRDIPGTGEVFPIKYKVKAPVENTLKPEIFELVLTINVKTYGIGQEFPDWVKAYEECKYILNNYVPKGEPYNKLNHLLETRKMTLGAEGLTELRNRMWKVASQLILAKGAEGYESEAAWANAITVTLEWTEWAGDIAFSALMAYATGGLAAGGLVATGAGMLKGALVEALQAFASDPQISFDEFMKRQVDKFVPMLMNMAKGRLLSIENIELIVRNNKPLAWTIFVSTEFLYNLYQTKSVYDAAKITAQGMVEEIMVQKLTKRLHQEALHRKIAYKSPQEFFDEIRNNTKVVNGEEVIDQKKLLEIMRDPEQVRTIKNLGGDKLKKIFQNSRNKIYEEHDFHLKQFIHEKYGIPKDDLVIDEFRTPGADPNDVNTDRDYRVLRKTVTKLQVTDKAGNPVLDDNGSPIYKEKVTYTEIQKPDWQEKSYEIFGDITGKPKQIDATEWAEKHQQRGTDKYDDEACSDYSDQVYNPKTGKIEVLDSNIKRVKAGKSTLIDAEETGNMYRKKVENSLKTGGKTEAYKQLQKSIDTLEEVRKGYEKQGKNIPELDSDLNIAMQYAKKIKSHITTDLDPDNYKNVEKHIKNMTGYDLNKLTNDIEKSFKDLKPFDKGTPK
ncbi:MAG: hypothetical protein KDC69_02190 [Flavobacteriaceae bacterium]|nr:hypothetical protein [Flavobacteriaceae bacterium]